MRNITETEDPVVPMDTKSMMITRIIMLMKGDDVMTIIITTGIKTTTDITTNTRNHNKTTDGEIIMKVKVTIDMITITKTQCS